MDISQIIALIRRYGAAIVEGRIEAKKIATMTDAELAAFDDELFAGLKSAQEEAEKLAAEQ